MNIIPIPQTPREAYDSLDGKEPRLFLAVRCEVSGVRMETFSCFIQLQTGCICFEVVDAIADFAPVLECCFCRAGYGKRVGGFFGLN
jgi:hypothetical protein